MIKNYWLSVLAVALTVAYILGDIAGLWGYDLTFIRYLQP